MSSYGDEAATAATRVWRGVWRVWSGEWRVWSGERRLERLERMEIEVLRQ